MRMAARGVIPLFQHTAARRRLARVYEEIADDPLFQHTAARRRLKRKPSQNIKHSRLFQHTAARRRLDERVEQIIEDYLFQHTAARRRLKEWAGRKIFIHGFNTQPPEGGCTKTCNR